MSKVTTKKLEKIQAKRGPKPKEFDPKEIERLAAIGLTQEEIAYNIGMHPDTWYTYINTGKTEISESYQKGKGNHAKVIIGGLTQKAINGDTTAMIFLAKAHLNRRENITLTHAGDPNNPLNVQVSVANVTPLERQAKIKALEEKKLLASDDYIDAEFFKGW